jgi:hypothetical protein
VSVISVFRKAPPAVTEADGGGDAEDDKNQSQEVHSKLATLIPIGCARALRKKQAHQVELSKKKIKALHPNSRAA